MTKQAILISGAVSAFIGTAACVSAQITVDGTLSPDYGSALSVQTANTGFGSGPAASGGNQLDAVYGAIQNGNLYLFFAGNTSDGNPLDVFIDAGGAGGQNILNLSAGSINPTATASMNGSVFSPGFFATYAVSVNTFAGTIYGNLFDLVADTGGYAGSAPDSGGTIGGVQVALNDSSPAGVGSNTGAGAAAVTTGWELAIPLSALGNPNSVEVMADINGNNENYLSDQFLPGLPDGTPNIGNGGVFNFASTPGEYFTVTASAPDGASTFELLLAGAGVMGVCQRRMARVLGRC
jgi:hypothetical protein